MLPDKPSLYGKRSALGQGVAWAMRDTFNAQQGIETVSVAQWIREHLR